MARQTAVALVVLVLGFALAGCIGDAEPDVTTSTGAADAVATSETGSITGQVVTEGLEVLVDVEIGLTNRTGGLELTRTDSEGRYTFNDLKPGQYRVQMTDECCRIKTVTVKVVAGHVSETNLKVEQLSDAERRLPYMVGQQWDGFLACGIAVGGNADDRCGDTDTNHDLNHTFTVVEGLEEIVAAMDWTPTTTAVSEDLRFSLHRPGGSTGDARCRHFLSAGPPPLIEHANERTTQCDDVRFSLINGTMDLQFEVAVGGIGATYQQAFTIYWYEFYNSGAPGDFNPLPDG